MQGTSCISINHTVLHGVPGDQIISAGNLINIDIPSDKNGLLADARDSFTVPPDISNYSGNSIAEETPKRLWQGIPVGIQRRVTGTDPISVHNVCTFQP